MVDEDARERQMSPAELERLARARALGMEDSVRELEEDPPLCASCQAPAPSLISDEMVEWRRGRFTVPGTEIYVALTFCPTCSAPSPQARVIVAPVVGEALRAAGCTCTPDVVIDEGELVTGHDDLCTMLRRKQGV
jgi:hypothetical protein